MSVAYYIDMALRILVSKISDGSMKTLDEAEFDAVKESRINFLLKNNLNPDAATLLRIEYNGDNYKRYIIANDELGGDGIVSKSTIVCDAIVTTDLNHPILLPLADCIGAVLYDESKNVLMVSHLGRHSLEQFGGSTSVEYLVKRFGVNPKDLKVWLSPAAGKEVYPLFAFDNRSLHEVASEQLISAGVLPQNIDVSPIDSAQDEDYFSHSQFLKEKRNHDGRFAIVAFIDK